MAISLHNLKSKKSANKRKKIRVGRGNASGKGTYSARGLKGQRARSGGKGGLKLKGFKRNLLNMPKFKGMKSKRNKPQEISLTDLNSNFSDGSMVTPVELLKKKLIKDAGLSVKILKNGEISIKIKVSGCLFTAAAKESIEKAGGSVILEAEKTSEEKEVVKDKKQNK